MCYDQYKCEYLLEETLVCHVNGIGMHLPWKNNKFDDVYYKSDLFILFSNDNMTLWRFYQTIQHLVFVEDHMGFLGCDHVQKN